MRRPININAVETDLLEQAKSRMRYVQMHVMSGSYKNDLQSECAVNLFAFFLDSTRIIGVYFIYLKLALVV